MHEEPATAPTATGRVTVRPMVRDDAAAVGALTLAAYDRYGSITGRYREDLADPTRRLGDVSALLVAELTDGHHGGPRLAGTVSYVTPDDAAWEHGHPPLGDAGFRILAVDPACEGRGVGAALVDAVLDRARAEGRHRVLLTSMAWMTRAHALYERRFGFVRRPDLDRTFPSGVGRVYALDLTPRAAERFPPPGPVPDVPPWFLDRDARPGC